MAGVNFEPSARVPGAETRRAARNTSRSASNAAGPDEEIATEGSLNHAWVKSVRKARWRICRRAVVNHFSDAVVQNPIVGQGSKNPALREWYTANLGRLPGLKFMRTLWVCNVAGGPFEYSATKPGSTPIGLEEAHREFQIASEEFDEVAAELGRSLDFFEVPQQEKEEVLAAFSAHKPEVIEGSTAAATR